MLTATGGEAVMYHSFLRWAPLRTSDRERVSGVMVAIETGRVTTYALQNLADRGIMFVRPGDDVYAGQVVGEHNRENDLGVNITKAKAFSNVRESNKEATVTLKAPRLLSLEAALEYVEADELVEITPAAVRLRKRVLDPTDRKRDERARRDRARAAT
jgi:GTP-binding protein